jgi:hypothetical protein
MSRIELRPMPQPPKGLCIGTLDGEPLVLVGREYHVGDRVLSQEDVAGPLVDAVDDAATRVLGHEWISSLARVMLINRRTTSRDRIARHGLPDYVYAFLAQAAAHPHPRALGHALLCVAELQDAHTTEAHASGRPATVDFVERNLAATATLRRAIHAVDEVLAERETFRARKAAQEAEWTGPIDSRRAPLTEK